MRVVKSIFVMAVLGLATGFQGTASAQFTGPAQTGGNAELVGRWELAEPFAGMPKGTSFEFRNDGSLTIKATANGRTAVVNARYSLNNNVIQVELPDGKKGASAIEKLTATELVLTEPDGNRITFVRAGNAQTPAIASDSMPNLPGTNWSGSENLGDGYGKLRFEFLANGKVVMHDAQSNIEGTYRMQGNQIEIIIPGSCHYVGVINGSTFTGQGQDRTRTWSFNVVLVK